jgi:hypothetical protein
MIGIYGYPIEFRDFQEPLYFVIIYIRGPNCPINLHRLVFHMVSNFK